MKAALGKTRESWHLAEAALLAQAEARRNYDWADSLDGMVWLGLRDADEEDDEEIEEIEDFEDPFMEVLEDNVWETDEDV